MKNIIKYTVYQMSSFPFFIDCLLKRRQKAPSHERWSSSCTLFAACFFALTGMLSPAATFAQDKIAGTFDSSTESFTPQDERYQVREYRDGFFKFKFNNLYGLIDSTGSIIAEAKYEEMDPFIHGLARVMVLDEWRTMYGYINKKGEEVIPLNFQLADDYYYRSMRFADHLVVVGNDNLYACYNLEGNLVLPMEYSNVGDFRSNRATLLKEGLWGYMNSMGEIVIPLEYDHASDFSGNFAVVKKEGHWGAIDSLGTEVIPIKYEANLVFSGGMALTKLGGKSGFIDRQGKVLLPFIYDHLSFYREGLAKASMDGKAGVIDTDGNVIIPFEYDWLGNFSEGFVIAKKDGLWGHLNRKGKALYPFEYEKTGDFHRGISNVMKNGKSGRIDSTGTLILPCRYDGIRGSYVEGMMLVTINYPEGRKKGFVNEDGVEVVKCEYSDTKDFSEGFAAVQKDGLWGFVNLEGKEVIPCTYSSVESFQNGKASVHLSGERFYIDQKGKRLP